jgi:hypothetical protein
MFGRLKNHVVQNQNSYVVAAVVVTAYYLGKNESELQYLRAIIKTP